ncbi:endo-1,4-beta-xylanase [Prosthecobacter fusiformis]|uniref:Endo-1,4-beta-xylanase n=1 Tax=Prosthecobacter fusiformis TaxID=48464 RepID=A0A4R7SQT5_9BACT|nr:alpha/beta hydrolase [Prosthecobacter fusiformis]TDU81284.1 endo-1,4-beta-xylanase [Prosthecobacter fusiformis]
MRLRISFFLSLLLTTCSLAAEIPEALPLWEKGAPGSEARKDEAEQTEGKNVVNVHNPSITPFIPTKDATGVAVIIAPGGGHSKLCLGHEGYALAEWFQQRGIAAFVLKYRLAREKDSTYTIQDHAMADMRRAIRTVRAGAKEWGINPERIGVMGFSAGGELAAFAAMKNDAGQADAADVIERASSRPDFQALIYPGTSGLFSAEKGMPPLFIACGYGDRPDIAEGMATLYLKYKAAGVKAELHIYSNAGHGFGYKPDTNTAAGRWPERFTEWLTNSGLMK